MLKIFYIYVADMHIQISNVNTEFISGDASLNANLPTTENFWQKLRNIEEKVKFLIHAFHRHWCKYSTIIESKYISKNIEHTNTHGGTLILCSFSEIIIANVHWKDFHFLFNPLSTSHTDFFFVFRLSSDFVLISFFGTGREIENLFHLIIYQSPISKIYA